MTAAQWQMALGEPGDRVSGLEELAQAVAMVLSTQLGAVPGRPTYGLDRLALVDEPLPTLAGRALREVRACFVRSLPRVELVRCTLQATVPEASNGRAVLQVEWRPKVGGEVQASEVTV